MAIMDMYKKLSSAIDRNEFALGIFLDLSKAFDTLNHKILCHKLEYYGIRGVTLKWFKNYLENRMQFVYLNDYNVSSSLRNVSCGIPQGSILGPLLFIIYINDITTSSSILKSILFADDTNLFNSNQNFQQLIESTNFELNKLSEWFKSNKLSLNVDKTKFIIFGNKHILLNSSQLILDGKILEQVKETKFLGVVLDEKLNWSQHINHISLKISRGLGIIG